VRSYGEFEFWFASIKVAAIIAFICLCTAYVLGLTGGDGGVGQLTAEGGFAPEGLGMVLTGVVIVIFAFVGAEIATVAAAESDEPKQAVTKATNSVIGRVLVFYVLSVFLIVAIVPWNSTKLGESPFVAALDIIGIAGAADIMNAVVLTAVLSCLNSGLYVASRMMFALAHRGDAPQWTIQLNSRGVPARAILLATSVGYVSVIAAALWPETIFLWLVNSSGAVALFVYLLIAVSELRMRARLEREDPERLEVRMWGYPWLTYLVIAAIVVVIASMALVDDVRSQLWWSLGSLAVVLGAYAARTHFGTRHEPTDRSPRFAREEEPARTSAG
jgi:GABA permease